MHTGSWREVQAPEYRVWVLSCRQREPVAGFEWWEDRLSGSGKEAVQVKGMDVTWEVICWEALR